MGKINTIDSFDGAYRFLSNFYMHPIVYKGIEFPGNEYAYQADKTDNIETKILISELSTPMQAKQIGKILNLRPNWEQEKYNVMYEINKIKYSDPLLALKLIETGNSLLIEGNTWKDTYWGMCNGVGENNLGKILMQIRLEIITSEILQSNVRHYI